MDRLLKDGRSSRAASNTPSVGSLPGCPPARDSRLATPASRFQAVTSSTTAGRARGPGALGLAVVRLARVEGRRRLRQACNRHRMASSGIPSLVALEKQAAWPATVSADIRALIRSMSEANPLWGAPRLHGEILQLGIDVSQATVAKYMGRRRRPPSQTWRTFLVNHVAQVMAADFFVVPTVTYRLLFVLVILAHDRRRIVHVAVTAHPTAAWTAQQLREAFPEDTAPRFLIHDRDTAFAGLPRTIRGMGVEDVVTACRSPWQNAYAERLIGSMRRECLDHVIILHEAGLRRILTTYVAYYHTSRTHLSLDIRHASVSARDAIGARTDRGDRRGRRSPSSIRAPRRVTHRAVLAIATCPITLPQMAARSQKSVRSVEYAFRPRHALTLSMRSSSHDVVR